MKAALFDSSGKKKSDISLPVVFNTPVRNDLVSKAVELARFSGAQPHALAPEAGKRHSASGTLSKKRHEWKGGYGRGASRTPRKTMYRHGTQFYWIGAEVANTRGGRRVHGPTLWKRYRKINDKEAKLALNSAIAATANDSLIVKRYSSLSKAPAQLPVFESLPAKTSQLMDAINNAYDNISIIESIKHTRAGKGKNRGRPHKENAGILLVVGKAENVKSKHVNIVKTNELSVLDLYPLGRLAAYTKQALEELKNA